jgi:hypothetical protein
MQTKDKILNYVFTIELLMLARRRELVPLVPLQIRISPIDITIMIIIHVCVVSMSLVRSGHLM